MSLFQKVKNMMLGTNYDSDDEYYGSEDEGYEYEDDRSVDLYTDSRDYARPNANSNVTYNTGRSSRPATSKIVDFRPASSSSTSPQVYIMHPKGINDAPAVCDHIRNNNICVVNLEHIDRPAAQRIADFLGGASYSVNGEIQRISNDIFVIVPEGIKLSGELRDELKNTGSIFPWLASAANR